MGERKIKVALFVHALTGGGAERVVSHVLRHLDRSRFEPLLILIVKKGVFLDDLPGDIRVLDCGRDAGAGRWSWVRTLADFLRSEQPDVVLSLLWYANAIAAIVRRLSGGNFRLVLSERSTVLGSREGWLEEALRRMAIRFLYPTAEAIVVNSEALRSQFTGHFGFPARTVHTIQNPLDIDRILASARNGEPGASRGRDRAIVVGMGRLSKEKGFDILLRAVACLRTPAKLLLLGEGRDQESLVRLARSLGISERVEFLGFRKNPYSVLREATVFALPSRYEGFPNGLSEAMALGIPCVATRCRTGPEELITHNRNGLLVPVADPVAMAAAIDRLLSDPALCERLGTAARAAAGRYDAPSIIRRYENVIESVVR